MLYQSTCVGFGYGPYARVISWLPFAALTNPVREDNLQGTSPLAGPGLLTWFPSPTAVALGLGAGSPRADWPCAGTLGLSAGEVLTLLVATHVSILTSDTSSKPHGSPSQAYGTLRYRSFEPAASVHGLSPGTSSAQDSY